MNFRVPSTDSQKYRTVKRGSTERLTILSGAAFAAADLEFPDEYCFFKVYLEDGTGMPAGADIEFIVNGSEWYSHDGAPILLENASAPFTWVIATLVGTSKFNLRLSVVTTDDLVFLVTPYERVEW